MNRVETAEFAKLLGVSQSEDGSWLGDIRAMARMVRKSVYRRGAATRQEVWQDWRSGFESLGEDTNHIRKSILDVAERIASVGDLVPVKIGVEYGWVKPKPRWVRISEKQAVVIGALSQGVENETDLLVSSLNADFVRRFDPNGKSSEGILLEAGETTLADWIGKGEWWQYVEDFESISEPRQIEEFWQIQLERLKESQIRSDPDAQFTFVLSGVGSFFGSLRSEEATGRWKHPSESPNGLYVGRRRGFNANDWRFFLCEVVDKAITKIVPLANRDEMIWTQIAKGVACQCEEKWTIEDNVISFQFPPPNQLTKFCDLIGYRVGIWKWQLVEVESSQHLNFWNEAT